MFHSSAGYFGVSKLDSDDGDDDVKKQDHIYISIFFMTFLSIFHNVHLYVLFTLSMYFKGVKDCNPHKYLVFYICLSLKPCIPRGNNPILQTGLTRT